MGNSAEARRVIQAALVRGRNTGMLRGILGMLSCQDGDLETGIAHLRAAHNEHPEDLGVVANLTTALTELGRTAEALTICSADVAGRDPSARLWRLRAFLLQVSEDFGAAAAAYMQVVAVQPDDFESWNNLGNARAATGEFDLSIAAIRRAIKLRSDVAPIRLNLASTLHDSGSVAEAIDVLRDAVAAFPEDARAWLELSGMLKQDGRDHESLEALKRAAKLDRANAETQINLGMEYLSSWSMDKAEEAFRAALAADPAHAEAHVMLAFLFEHLNRTDEFCGLISAAEDERVDPGTVDFIRAMACRREQKFEEGLAVLKAKPDSVEPVRSAQMEGQFHDRLGHTELAFSAFSEMNRLQRLDPTDPPARAALYRAKIASDRTVVTEAWYAGWRTESPPDDHPSPVILLGFPRSGTTLLDTLLMGHPQVDVLEERPMIRSVENELGSFERLAKLNDLELAGLRQTYFAEADNWHDKRPNAVLIDKNPLHLNKVPILHRLFPDAKFVLALRHPCDVVLSCFITNFRLNNAMSNFTDLTAAAELYAESFGFWEQCRALMPLAVHAVRYEEIVADKAQALRPVFDFLGLPWHDDALDHRQTAAERGIISTASYAQVTEPIYDRAAGRWQRYREQLAPVIPILRPWIERFGYEL